MIFFKQVISLTNDLVGDPGLPDLNDTIEFFKTKLGQFVLALILMAGFWAYNFYGVRPGVEVFYGGIDVGNEEAYIPFQVGSLGEVYKFALKKKEPRYLKFGIKDPDDVMKEETSFYVGKGKFKGWHIHYEPDQTGEHIFWVKYDRVKVNLTERVTVEIRKYKK